MKYTCSIEIDRPRVPVLALFEDTDRMGEWQDGLESFAHVSGEPGTPGAKSEIKYQMGKRRIEMIETIESYNMPDSMVTIYEAGSVWNRNENRFIEDGSATRWEMDCEFRCGGFMRIMAFVMPGAFKRQTQKMMNDFKFFAEREIPAPS